MPFNKPDILRIQVDSNEIFHEVDFTLDATTDFEEIATKDSGGKQVTPGSQSWSASINTVGSADVDTKETELEMTGYWLNKTLVTIDVTDAIVGNVKYSGSAYVENFSVSAGVEGTVDISYSLKGSGTLTIAAVAV